MKFEIPFLAKPVSVCKVLHSIYRSAQHRQTREDVVRQVRRCLHHAPCVARGADTTAFAGIGHEVVVPAVITPGPGKAMDEDAALQIFAESLTGIGLGGVAVALAVELTRAGEFMPSLEVFGYGLVEQRALGVAWVVELGFGARWPARV